MEQEYVIGVTNRYALFLDESSHEEDPFEIIKNAEAEKSKKKTPKAVSGESKENKGKPDPKGKTALTPGRKTQGIKETQNVKPADTGASKPKPQDGGLKTTKPAGPRKTGDRAQGDRPVTGTDKTVKFASGEPQGERPNRRNRDEKSTGERNGDIQRNRNFRDGDKGSKGSDNESGLRGSRSDGDGPRGPRRDGGDRPFRSDRNDRQSGDSENRPPRRENRERRDFQERSDFPRDGAENGDGRPDRRPGSTIGRTKGNRPERGPGRNFDNRGKREFERKSGSDKTGVKAIDKRDGAGAHNWGNHKDDLEVVANNLNSTTLSDDNAEGDGKPVDSELEGREGEGNITDSEPAAPVEEEPKELTLDEYKAMRGKRELPQYNIRKAGEGEDLTQWKNMYEIKKKKEDEPEEEAEYDAAEYPQRVGRQRHVLDIDITFSDSRRGPRGARNGRAPRPSGLNAAPGSGRARQREGPRRGREGGTDYGTGRDRDYRGNRQSAPKVDDEHDFPSLG